MTNPSVRLLITLILVGPAFAQPSSDLVEGQSLYAQRCAVCHGEDAHGTERAPGLAGNRRLRSRSKQQVAGIIRNGILSAGMPAFDMPKPELEALVAFVHSLNSPAADSVVPGDASAGERFFFGQDRCESCHMVHGRGSAIGPDLSSTGREMTLTEIREALLKPGAHITPGYEIVTVELRGGNTIRGFARNRSNFDLQLQDLQGRFHLLQMKQIVAIRNEPEPFMPPLKAAPGQVRDLIAYLSRLDGVQPGPIAAAPPQPGPTDIDFSRIVDPHPGDWLTYNGNLSGNRYSELTAINRFNISALVPKWTSSLGRFGLEATPIFADGVMYVTGANQAFALDALTGREIWRYSRPATPGLLGDAALGSHRGMAILGDKVFMVTDNAHLLALNRVTGSLVWEAVMPDEPQHYGSTVAPLIVKDMVIAGVSGGDRGIRGFLSAYKANTGERVWRIWTIPYRGEPGSETWKEKEPTFGGGGTWLTGSYDPEADTLYWPVGNPYPDSDDRQRSGDNLYTDCVLALNPDTGKLKWHYQFTPHDIHDWDATEPMLLVNARYQGRERKLLLHADRNGFFYVLDRTNGKVLMARPFVKRLTWASGIGPDGRPQLLPGYIPPPGGNIVCPAGEATNWGSTAFSPTTRLFYLMALEKCTFAVPHGTWTARHPKLDPARKYLRALDIETGKIVWEIPETGTTESKHWSGVLATAGGLLFYGDPSGAVVAVDERDGKALWHFPTTEAIKASPMTYTVDGKQFIAIAAGATILCFGLP